MSSPSSQIRYKDYTPTHSTLPPHFGLLYIHEQEKKIILKLKTTFPPTDVANLLKRLKFIIVDRDRSTLTYEHPLNYPSKRGSDNIIQEIATKIKDVLYVYSMNQQIVAGPTAIELQEVFPYSALKVDNGYIVHDYRKSHNYHI